jgi:uncharacterized protein (DUF362 family)
LYSAYLVDQPDYDPEAILTSVVRILELEGLQIRGKTVFVKPSFVYPAHPPLNRGINTQPELVGGVVHALKKLGARRIWVGEDCLAGPGQAAFLGMGVLPYLRGVAEPVFLDAEPRMLVSVPGAQVESEFRMPRRMMEADLLISLPKIKVNMYATVTLSVKNHIGLLLAEDRLTQHHYDIHKKIADLYQTRLPDMVIADAIVAGEGQGPMHAGSVPLGLILASSNGLAADLVACELMGYRHDEVAHLSYLSRLGLGPASLAEVEIDGADLLAARARRFVRPSTDLGELSHAVRCIIGSELACAAGCVGMIRGSLDRFAQIGSWGPVQGLTFIAGKPLSHLPADLDRRRTFVVGDCAEPFRDLGTYIPGCSVKPLAITWALARRGVLRPLATRYRDLVMGTAAAALHLPLGKRW